MADSPQCPSAETLALLPDGRASRRVRLSLMVHLDGCTRCRSVLACTGPYEPFQEPGPTPLKNPRTYSSGNNDETSNSRSDHDCGETRSLVGKLKSWR